MKTSVIVGGVIEKDGKFLLVQEAKAKCRGKWNLPAGHLDVNETLLEGAKREIYEECGLVVEPTGVCQIGNTKQEDKIFVGVFFSTKIISGEIRFDTAEILDVKWFSYEEILAMKTELRASKLIIEAIENVRAGLIAPLDLITVDSAA